MEKVILLTAVLSVGLAASGRGQSFQLDDAQLAKLTDLIRSNPEAKEVFDGLRADAELALASEPNPIESIRSEGLLNKDPLKIATESSLKDMGRIYSLCAAWAILKDDRYLQKAKEYLVAWADKNKGRGDPIDDTNLEAAIRGYDFVKQAFADEQRRRVEGWLSQVADMEIEVHDKYPGRSTAYNNWNSHRLKIVGLVAFVTGNKGYLDYTLRDYKIQISRDLRPDGSSYDFMERDALHYHLYTLEPLLSLCAAAQELGYDLYGYESPEGSSLKKSAGFTIPFATGEKTHAEYVNSKVEFDRDRARAGQKEFAPGRLFEPKEALLMLGEYFFFDRKVLPLIQELAGTKSSFPSWLVLVESAQSATIP